MVIKNTEIEISAEELREYKGINDSRDKLFTKILKMFHDGTDDAINSGGEGNEPTEKSALNLSKDEARDLVECLSRNFINAPRDTSAGMSTEEWEWRKRIKFIWNKLCDYCGARHDAR